MHLDENFVNDNLLVHIFKQGYVGVSFFFVLSGFILTYTYVKQIKDKNFDNKKFLIKRVFRLGPLHFITALPFIIISIYNDSFNVISTILNISFLQAWIPNVDIYYYLNTPAWSLSNEMFFYICFFPLVALSLKRKMILFTVLLVLILTTALCSKILNLNTIFFGNKTLSH